MGVLGPQFWDTVYISEVSKARKVKSDAQVAMNKKSDHVQKFFFSVAGGLCPRIFPNFKKCPK